MRPITAFIAKNRSAIGVCLILALGTLALYLPSVRNGFVNIDDNDLIIDNTNVTAGLTVSGVAWALQSGHSSNWHPVTWISHMLDCSLYGLNPAGHHLTSVLFHAANCALLFLVFYRMTGSLWRSAFTGALFAWHPLHVESVAWASERKDVLSTCFWLLTMLAYARYVKESDAKSPRAKLWYGWTLLFFVLGLMSKPMVVTLPCALLLMDYWPLKRGASTSEQPTLWSLPWKRLILEKVPFFLLALAASVATYLVQKKSGAVAALDELPLSVRAGNAVVAYFEYLSKTIWPVNLSAFYPYSSHQSAAIIVTSVVLLAAFSGLFLLVAQRRPYLVTGWFWYLGTLVPTIGLVQVGSQSMADRYMYIPSIGFFALVVWGVSDFLESWRPRRAVLGWAGGLALAACCVATFFQISYWHDSEKLFRHAIESTKDNYIAYNGLGGAFAQEGYPAKARAAYEITVQIKPGYCEGQYNLGTSLLEEGDLEGAVAHLNLALKANRDFVPAHDNLGKALLQQGKTQEAMAHLLRAVELQPGYAEAHYNLGTLLFEQGKLDEAIGEFSTAVRLKPHYAQALGNLGIALMRAGRAAEGIANLTEAARLKPDDAGAQANLGMALLEHGQPAQAVAQFSEVVRLRPADARANYNLAAAQAKAGQSAEAVITARKALALAQSAGQTNVAAQVEKLSLSLASAQPYRAAE